MSVKYPNLPLTEFPEKVDPIEIKKDVDSSIIKEKIKTYLELMNTNIQSAKDYLIANPDLKPYFINSDIFNRLSQQISAIQSFYLDDIRQYIIETVLEIPDASLSKKGIVSLSNSMSDSQTEAITPYALKSFLTFGKGKTSILSGSNLNTYIVPGNYYCSVSSPNINIANYPFTNAFNLTVLNPVDDQLNVVVQEITTITGDKRIRYTHNSGTAWSAWTYPSVYV